MIARKVVGFAALVATGLILEKAAWGVFDSAAVPSGTSLQVQRVVPEGKQVPSPGRQIVVTFDRPVKTLGDLSVPHGESPASVSPAVACQWHWLDPRSLACELNDKNALVPATRYTVTVAPGIKAQDGAVLESAYTWSFTTERPADHAVLVQDLAVSRHAGRPAGLQPTGNSGHRAINSALRWPDERGRKRGSSMTGRCTTYCHCRVNPGRSFSLLAHQRSGVMTASVDPRPEESRRAAFGWSPQRRSCRPTRLSNCRHTRSARLCRSPAGYRAPHCSVV